MMEKFTNNLMLCGFSQGEIDYIIRKGSVEHIAKGIVFLHSGRYFEKIGFLFKGIMGGWYIDDNADKRFSQFYYYPENDVVIDYESYLYETKSKLTIETISDCDVLVFTRQNIELLKDKFPQFLTAEKMLAQEKFTEAQKILEVFQNSNAVERIRFIQKHAPEILAKVPYTHIASYLGLHRNSFRDALKKL